MFNRPSLPATGFGALMTGVELSALPSSADWAKTPGARIVLAKAVARPVIPRRNRMLGVRVKDVMEGVLMHCLNLAASPNSP